MNNFSGRICNLCAPFLCLNIYHFLCFNYNFLYKSVWRKIIMESTNNTLDGIREARIQKLTDLIDKGINPYPYSYDRNISAAELQKDMKTCLQAKKRKTAIPLQGVLWQCAIQVCLLTLWIHRAKFRFFLIKKI